MNYYLILLIFLIGISNLQAKTTGLVFYQKGKSKKTAKGIITYETGLYKIKLEGGGEIQCGKSQIIGIAVKKPKSLLKVEVLSSSEITSKASLLLLENNIVAFGWSHYIQFLRAFAFVDEGDYGKAIDSINKINNEVIKRSPSVGSVTDSSLINFTKLYAQYLEGKVPDFKGKLKSLLDLNVSKNEEYNYLLYLEGKLFEKEGNTNLAIINYLKVVFLEKGTTIYKLSALRKIIHFYKKNSDNRYKVFKQYLEKLLKVIG